MYVIKRFEFEVISLQSNNFPEGKEPCLFYYVNSNRDQTNCYVYFRTNTLEKVWTSLFTKLPSFYKDSFGIE